MSDETPSAKLWAGRFTEPTDALVERFTESVSFDRRLAKHDIRGSIAHATMLAEVGVLTEQDRDAIVGGLEGILADIEAGAFEWRTALEDVHMNVESVLTERIGDAGKRLHTGRSRNDQVATDVRLFVREALDDTRCRDQRHCKPSSSKSPSAKPRPCFPDSRIFSPRSRSPSVTTCSHGSRCWSATPSASPSVVTGSIACRSVQRRSRGRRTPSTAP